MAKFRPDLAALRDIEVSATRKPIPSSFHHPHDHYSPTHQIFSATSFNHIPHDEPRGVVQPDACRGAEAGQGTSVAARCSPSRLWLKFASSLCAQRDNLKAKGTKEKIIDALIEKHDPFPVPPYVREPFTV